MDNTINNVEIYGNLIFKMYEEIINRNNRIGKSCETLLSLANNKDSLCEVKNQLNIFMSNLIKLNHDVSKTFNKVEIILLLKWLIYGSIKDLKPLITIFNILSKEQKLTLKDINKVNYLIKKLDTLDMNNIFEYFVIINYLGMYTSKRGNSLVEFHDSYTDYVRGYNKDFNPNFKAYNNPNHLKVLKKISKLKKGQLL